jgi:hypothetical protein
MRRMPASASWLCFVASVEERRFHQPARLNARSSEVGQWGGIYEGARRGRFEPRHLAVCMSGIREQYAAEQAVAYRVSLVTSYR